MEIIDLIEGKPAREADPLQILDDHLAHTPHEQRESRFHVSQLFDLCPIQETLMVREPKDLLRTYDAESWWAFRFGRAIHSVVQNELLGPLGMWFGFWRCNRCGSPSPSFGPMPSGRPDCCEISAWEYIEPKFEDPATGIIGYCDGFVGSDVSRLFILEVKTMNGVRFSKLDYSDIRHQFQGQVYNSLAQRHGPVRTHGVIVLYVGKGPHTKFGRHVRFKHAPSEEPISIATKRIERIHALADSQLPLLVSDRICKHPSDLTATKCPYVQECFFSNALRHA